jgi:ABC-2 type transport system permease protein
MVIASPAFIISGFTWPLSAMPAFVQFIANIIPLTPFLQAFKILINSERFSRTYFSIPETLKYSFSGICHHRMDCFKDQALVYFQKSYRKLGCF